MSAWYDMYLSLKRTFQKSTFSLFFWSVCLHMSKCVSVCVSVSVCVCVLYFTKCISTPTCGCVLLAALRTDNSKRLMVVTKTLQHLKNKTNKKQTRISVCANMDI